MALVMREVARAAVRVADSRTAFLRGNSRGGHTHLRLQRQLLVEEARARRTAWSRRKGRRTARVCLHVMRLVSTIHLI
jgi:hypothetical protein